MKKKLVTALLALSIAMLYSKLALATTISLKIDAYIDGRDLLIVDDDTLQWHHLDYAAVGRWLGANEPTYLSLWIDGTLALDNYAWTPVWPDPPPSEIRYEAYSDILAIPFVVVPDSAASVVLTPLIGRYSISTLQGPSALNGYELVLDFNDDPPSGAAWYSARVDISTSTSLVPEPSSMLLVATGIAALAGTRCRRKG
jgi:hypothetical protein